MKSDFFKLKTLVCMQLRDKLDLSFAKSIRSLIIKIALAVLKLVVITALFFGLFYFSNLLSVFSFSGVLPDTVVNLLFTAIQLMSIVTCTVGLTQALYLTQDNKVLLTLPVKSSDVFFSKLLLYYIFELKKNLTLTLPIFIAYGIVCNAVWYYYFWMLVCFVFVSLLPVAIGAALSIPSLYIAAFVKNYRWLQAVLATIAATGITLLLFWIVGQLPENIDLVGQWGSISASIQKFLKDVASVFRPYYLLTLMIVGGSLRISSQLFGGDTFVSLGVLVGVLAVLLTFSYFVVKPLFLKMASKEFEFGTAKRKNAKNICHTVAASAFDEAAKINLRSSRYLLGMVVQLVLPALMVYFQSRLYAAMNTSYSGAIMTQCFSVLIIAVAAVSFNNRYASVYSREGNARNILKTRPINPIFTLLSRIYIRAAVATVSVIAAAIVYSVESGLSAINCILTSFMLVALVLAHLLWAAESDLMNSQAEQYDTVGLEFDNPNERKAGVTGFLCAVILVGAMYLFTDRGVTTSLIKCSVIAAAFLAARFYLFTTRAKLYFIEK